MMRGDRRGGFFFGRLQKEEQGEGHEWQQQPRPHSLWTTIRRHSRCSGMGGLGRHGGERVRPDRTAGNRGRPELCAITVLSRPNISASVSKI